MSSSLLYRCKPKRSEARASSSERPIARSTCEGSALAVAQAAPDETANIAGNRLQQRLAVYAVDSHVQIVGQTRLDRAIDVHAVQPAGDAPATGDRAAPAAVPRLGRAARGTFQRLSQTRRSRERSSVPERYPRSCPPPSMSGSRSIGGRRLATYSAPTPFGTVDLVRAERDEIDSRLATSSGTLAGDCAASQWKSAPRCVGDARRSPQPDGERRSRCSPTSR